jgi:hypothetical protein
LSLPAQAQRGGPSGPRFDDRLDRQSSAIQRGIDSGELTRREARTLRREQDEARQFMRDLRREGYPPHEARRMIDRRLDRVDRQIRRAVQTIAMSRRIIAVIVVARQAARLRRSSRYAITSITTAAAERLSRFGCAMDGKAGAFRWPRLKRGCNARAW